MRPKRLESIYKEVLPVMTLTLARVFARPMLEVACRLSYSAYVFYHSVYCHIFQSEEQKCNYVNVSAHKPVQ